MTGNSLATRGRLSGGKYGKANLMASRGMVNLFVIAIIGRSSFPFTGGSEKETRIQRIIREDEEILMFIKAFMERWDP